MPTFTVLLTATLTSEYTKHVEVEAEDEDEAEEIAKLECETDAWSITSDPNWEYVDADVESVTADVEIEPSEMAEEPIQISL